jgi:hypothetical protein
MRRRNLDPSETRGALQAAEKLLVVAANTNRPSPPEVASISPPANNVNGYGTAVSKLVRQGSVARTSAPLIPCGESGSIGPGEEATEEA